MKIEKDIPIPRKVHCDSKWRDLVDKMNVWESVFIEAKNDAHSLCNSIKRYEPEHRGTMRREKQGYRVWKVKR